MRSTLNALGLACCVLGSTLGVWATTRAPTSPVDAPASQTAWVTDAAGTRVQAASYQRIASLHFVADQLLLELVEPSRVVGITEASATTHPTRWRFDGPTSLGPNIPPEDLLTLTPDLVIASQFMDASLTARLRESDVPVFELGAQTGIRSTLDQLALLGQLLQVPERSDALRERFEREIDGLRAHRPTPRPQAIYLTRFGDNLYGGTTGSSIGELFELAGVHDVAGPAGYQGWPELTAEQLLELDPPLIVSPAPRQVCEHPGLRTLQACSEQAWITLPAMADPGPGLLRNAKQLQDRLRK